MPFRGVLKIHEILMGQIDVLPLDGEMEQMVDDKNENNNPAHQHRARGVTGRNHLVLAIGNRACPPVFHGELRGGHDVEHHQHN